MHLLPPQLGGSAHSKVLVQQAAEARPSPALWEGTEGCVVPGVEKAKFCLFLLTCGSHRWGAFCVLCSVLRLPSPDELLNPCLILPPTRPSYPVYWVSTGWARDNFGASSAASPRGDRQCCLPKGSGRKLTAIITPNLLITGTKRPSGSCTRRGGPTWSFESRL